MLRGGGEEKGGTRETERDTHVCASTVRGSKESKRPSGGCQRRGEDTGLHTEDGPLITAQGERKGEGRKLMSSHLTDEMCPSKAALPAWSEGWVCVRSRRERSSLKQLGRGRRTGKLGCGGMLNAHL